MSDEIYKSSVLCVGGRHCRATISIEGDKTQTQQNFLFCNIFQSNGKNSMIVSDNTIQVESLDKILNVLGRSSTQVGKKLHMS